MTNVKLSGSAVAWVAAVASLSLATAVTGWASSALAQQPQSGDVATRQAGSPRTIALAPGGGLLGEAVAAELKGRGYGVVSLTPAVASLGATPAAMQGVDAVLTVKATTVVSGEPQTVTALIATPSGQVLAQVNWSNYWGGWRGPKGAAPNSDRRRTVAQAAVEIAEGLVRTL